MIPISGAAFRRLKKYVFKLLYCCICGVPPASCPARSYVNKLCDSPCSMWNVALSVTASEDVVSSHILELAELRAA